MEGRSVDIAGDGGGGGGAAGGRRKRRGFSLMKREDRSALLTKLEKRLQDSCIKKQAWKQTAMDLILKNSEEMPMLSQSEEWQLSKIIKLGTTLEKKKEALSKQKHVTRSRHNGSIVKGTLSKHNRDDQHKSVILAQTTSKINRELARSMGINADQIESIIEDKQHAKHILVQYHLRMVVAIAKQHSGNGQDLEDLISEGMAGLNRAAEKFDLDKGFKFSTYAYYWIRQAVSRCASNQSRVIRLPIHVCDALSRIRRLSHELSSEPGREGPVEPEEISRILGIPEDKVRLYLKASAPVKSLDAPAGKPKSHKMDDSPPILSDIVSQDEGPMEDVLRDTIIKENLNIVLGTLHPRERNVLRMRYGLHKPGGESMKFNDISAAYGVSPERIRQIEEKAMRKLRRPWRKSLLTIP